MIPFIVFHPIWCNGNISRFHRGAPGSIPGIGSHLFSLSFCRVFAIRSSVGLAGAPFCFQRLRSSPPFLCRPYHLLIYFTRAMEVPNVEQLLDYVFTPEDFQDDPTTQEYKKLVRVMKARFALYPIFMFYLLISFIFVLFWPFRL